MSGCGDEYVDLDPHQIALVKGETGEKGDRGHQGCQGKQGSRGTKGDTGAQGGKGDRGDPGEKGDAGPKGGRGDRGERGEKGDTGDRGETGEIGHKGDKGDTGCKGDTGNTGPKGDTGSKGEKGDTGSKGDPGEKGSVGDTGEKGDKGDTGDKGDPGDKGDTGEKGDKGDTGDKGDKGDTGDKGEVGTNGTAGAPGLNAFVSCTDPDDSGCFEMTMRDQNGQPVTKQFQDCVRLLGCGYAGTPICASNATGTVMEISAGNVFDIAVNHTVAGGVLTSAIQFTDTIQSGTTSISNVRFEGGRLCIDVVTQGKLDFNNVYDKTALPKTPQGCTSPLSGEVEIDGLSTGGQATQINKTTGGTVIQTGFEDIGNSNYNVISNDNSWIDTVNPQLFGGIPGADLGANFSFIVDTFGDTQQTYTICESVCYYEPIEFQATLDGTPIPGTGVDSNGNPYTGVVIDPATGEQVTV